MLNILVPLAGPSRFFEGNPSGYPKPLIEINGRSMIERVIENLGTLDGEKKFVFVIRSEDCRLHHLDNVLEILTGGNCKIVKLGGETKGAACSSLVAIDHIDGDAELLISNGDQIILENLNGIRAKFRSDSSVQAGVVTFNTVHPHWSYVKLGPDGHVIEAAEKRPISRHAIAGLYYFRSGSAFIRAAMDSIRKDASIDHSYFIAPTLNEIILKNGRVAAYEIHEDKYVSFYTPQKIEDYVRNIPR